MPNQIALADNDCKQEVCKMNAKNGKVKKVEITNSDKQKYSHFFKKNSVRNWLGDHGEVPDFLINTV